MGKLTVRYADGDSKGHDIVGPVDVEQLDHGVFAFVGRDRRLLVNRDFASIEYEPDEPEREHARFEEFIRNEFAGLRRRLEKLEHPTFHITIAPEEAGRDYEGAGDGDAEEKPRRWSLWRRWRTRGGW